VTVWLKHILLSLIIIDYFKGERRIHNVNILYPVGSAIMQHRWYLVKKEKR